MKTVNYEGEVTCPLCMEAMDLTDQQFKPCECGYQICVWCWHHMVEAEQNEVLCPACQTPYDKERIKGMTINNDRLAKISSIKKKKLQKAKSSASEVRYDPSENRVIQRNLVYMIGIPDYLANEEMLRKREFLGQYGKVLRILFKQPSKSGQAQYTKTSAVYVTFSKEEEAVRCIQVVNGFVLNGCPLKACYGTTRYCHAWLLKKTCKNANCSYLHYTAPPGDICTKDETVLVCTSKIQQYSGFALNLGPRSGSFLPPPVDNYCSGIDNTQSISDCDKNLRGGDGDEKFDAPPRTYSCVFAATSPRELNVSTAFSQGPRETLNMSNSSIMSAAVMEVQLVEQNEYENQNEMHTQALDGHENSEESTKYCESDCPVDNISPSLEGNFGTNIESKSTRHKPFSLWSNDDLIQSIITDLSSSDLDGDKHLTPITRIEAEGASKCLYDKESKYLGTCDTGVTNDGIGTSFISEHERLYPDYPGCHEQDELSTDKLVKDMVQNIDPWCNSGVDLRRYPISNRIFVNSSEYGIKSDISVDRGLVALPVDPNDLVDHHHGTNRGDCLTVYNSLLPLNSSESKYSFKKIDSSQHTRGQFFPGYADLIDLKSDYHQRKIDAMKPGLIDTSASVAANLGIRNGRYGYSRIESPDQSQHLLRLPQSAPIGPSISKSVITPPPRGPRHPPGFPPIHSSDIGQSCASPFGAGTTQFKLSGNQSLTNFSQVISRSNSYFSTDPIDAIKMASGGLTSPDYYSSNLLDFGGSNPGVQHQYRMSLGNLSENSLVSTDQSNTYLSQNSQHGMKNYPHGSQDEMESVNYMMNGTFWSDYE